MRLPIPLNCSSRDAAMPGRVIGHDGVAVHARSGHNRKVPLDWRDSIVIVRVDEGQGSAIEREHAIDAVVVEGLGRVEFLERVPEALAVSLAFALTGRLVHIDVDLVMGGAGAGPVPGELPPSAVDGAK